MKSKIFIFTTLILVVFLFVITSCNYFLNGNNNTTININLDLSKIVKTSRNVTASNSTEYILKVFAYNAASYKPKDEIENLPLLTQTENKVDVNGKVKARLDVEIGLNVIFVAKLYQEEAEKPLYAGKSEVIKIKATDNKVHLVLTRENADIANIPEGFVLIPAGTFQMGSEAGYSDNKPVHQVTITKSFYMGKYEVTQAEYEKYCSYGGNSPSLDYGDGDNYPAYYVSWYDALVYCNKRSVAERLTPCYRINESTDPNEWGTVPTSNDDTWNAVVCDWNANGYRLPTEAEWEYAARAGDNTVDSLTYSGTSDVNKLGEYAWYDSNSNNAMHEVGTKFQNAYGLYDMSGNGWEWCWNWWTDSYDTGKEGGSDPTGSSAGADRVNRGGGWDFNSDYCAVSYRGSSHPCNRYFSFGFRVVRTATEVSDHTHSFSTEWTSNVTHHWHAATCEHDVTDSKAAHSFGNWTVTKEATEEAEGSKEQSCTVCGYTATEVIEKLAHTHKFSTDWTKDETHHWHKATCEHSTEVSEKSEHSFNWEVTKEASCTEKGEKKGTCTSCGYEKTEITDKAEHSYANGVCICGLPEGFVLIPAGTFQMGSNAGETTEQPVQEVTITKDFYMGKYEVTQAEYEKYCSYTGSYSPSSTYGDGENYPAYYVSWYDALVYCNKRSIDEGLTPCYSISGNTDPEKWEDVPRSSDTTWNSVVCNWEANGYRLPTEAEWEYAARAGDNTVSSLTWAGTNSESKLGEYAWYSDNSSSKTHEVGTRKANGFGLYDMTGNVSEWCWNWFTDGYNTGTEGGSDPTGASSGESRVLRGGCFVQDSGLCAVSYRNYFYPYYRNYFIGFRVVRSATE